MTGLSGSGLGPHTITLITPADRDPYGDPGGDDVETDITGCNFQPRATVDSSELNDNRHTVIAGWVVFVPAGWVVRSTDRIRFAGELYEVDGEPAVWPGAHTEVPLQRVTG